MWNVSWTSAAFRNRGAFRSSIPLRSPLRCANSEHAKKDSVNLGWRNASFRGYADYMASAEFRDGLERLLQLARQKRTAIVCAEAVPWRCHRSLIGDALLVRGVHVEDIMSATSARPHEMTPFARVIGLNIVYPAEFEQAKFPLS